MKAALDLSCDHDLDRVAEITAELAERIRDEDPRRVFNELVGLCAHHPAKAAQVIMTFAAWFDPETPTRALWARVESITRPREVAYRRSA